MRNSLKVLISLCVVMMLFGLGASGFAESNKGLRYAITVSKFENKSNWSGKLNLGDAWGAVLTDSLTQTGKFIVLGEKDMRQEAMEEQDFAASGRAAGGGKKVVTGQMTPAQLLVKGTITHFAEETKGSGLGLGYKGFKIGGKLSMSEINVLMYIVDSSTGQVMASKKCYGKVQGKGISFGVDRQEYTGDLAGFKKTNTGKAMEKAVEEGVEFLISKLEEIPWTGSVILVKGDKAYINRGEREGVNVGQVFAVGESTILRDPDTGEVLDESMDIVGKIEVTKVKNKISIGKIREGSGIQKGMTVMVRDSI